MKKRKLRKRLLTVIITLLILTIINFIPTYNLKANMNKIESEYFILYYGKEKKIALETKDFLDNQILIIKDKLNITNNTKINIYLFDNKEIFQTKRFGYITLLLNKFIDLSWYYGDNISNQAILTSPADHNEYYSIDTIKGIALHEIIHAYNYSINPKIPKWLNEGVALYLSNGSPIENIEYYTYIPTYKDFNSNNPLHFNKVGGYQFSYEYIAYLDKTYGWQTILSLLKENDYNKVFNKDKETIFNDWITHLTKH